MLSRKRPDSAISSRFHPDSPVLNTNVIRFVFSVWQLRTESVPTASRFSRMRSDIDPTVTRQWTDADGRSGHDRDSIGKKRQLHIFPNYHDSVPIITTPSRHRPDHTRQCYDFNPTQPNLLRHSYDCNPTRHNRLSLPNGTGRTSQSGVICRPSRPSRLCYERSRLRPDNDRTFPISPDSNPTFSFFVS